MIPTLEEVKKYFENVKVVKSTLTGDYRHITDEFFHSCVNTAYHAKGIEQGDTEVWSYNKGYAEIIEYKQQEIMNKELIGKLTKGKIAVHNNGTREELRKVLKEAFPKDNWEPKGTSTYYRSSLTEGGKWSVRSTTPSIPVVSTIDFFKTEESKEDKLNSLQKELDALRQSIKEDKELKTGDVAVRIVNTSGGSHYLGKIFKVEGIDERDNLKEVGGITHVRSSCRKATTEETEKFNNKIELPTIEGYAGKDRGKHVDFGCQAFLKSDLEVLGKLGITSFNLIVGGEKVIVSKYQTEQLNTYLKES